MSSETTSKYSKKYLQYFWVEKHSKGDGIVAE